MRCPGVSGKKILILGGSYFIGRVFCILASRTDGFDITVANRGTFPLNLRNVAEERCDRRDAYALAALAARRGDFDCVIDFCAYEPDDCRKAVCALFGRARQYIYIGSCSVFAASDGAKSESATMIVSPGGGDPASVYSFNKMMLEGEASRECQRAGMECTIIRPSMVYGPFNYAPRESWYFERIIRGATVPWPIDASGAFVFVYVKDVAEALMRCVGNPAAYGESFNLAGAEIIDYAKWMGLLRSLGYSFPVEEVHVEDVYRERIAVPWPLDAYDVFDGGKAARVLGISYTVFDTGMRETFEVWRKSHAD
jgi:nucleoside-diphosphate-sugar epimerase